jgi:hypothetical protein
MKLVLLAVYRSKHLALRKVSMYLKKKWLLFKEILLIKH